ncbi:MAG: HIT domain-containing protein [Candidatus Nanoarchaeia archaeon]|nr:HIT domain-containing protein [Candidatus Nanoarchaeia archaeon]MDD5741173.1 HIT domain-containing protein [Candidatus Nanoarchaeia archaeon]
MAITPEQAEEIKKQLLQQIESSEMENKEQIKEYVTNLDEEQLEEFLKQNKIQLSEEGQLNQTAQGGQATQCIFCSIISNHVPSYRIAENKKATAILEINPISRGHTIVIPNEHTTIEKLPKSSLSLAQRTAKKIKKKLNAEDVKIETASAQGHAIINVIPFYKDKKLEKHKAEESELKELQLILETKKRSPRQKKTTDKTAITKESIKSLQKISFRIP